MTLIWQLAFRYLRGKRGANAVPILSRISMVAIAVSSGAMIVIFSVFNGLESLVKEMYRDFYPDIKISVAKGKFFAMDSSKLAEIGHLKGVMHMSAAIEDNVIANNHELQKIFVLKGIDNNYFHVNDLRQYIVSGVDSVSSGYPYTAIGGMHILSELGADVNTLSYIEVFYPNPNITNPESDPLSAYQSLKLHPAGIFKIQEEFDNRYVFAPLSLVQNLFQQKGRYSFIEIKAATADVAGLKQDLQKMLGKDFNVATRFEQNKTLNMIMGAEKWAIYAILLLVFIIASSNMVGALSMLVLEKQKDIGILRAMGAQPGTIRTIFLLEGILWSLVGGVSGMVLGFAICLAQQQFGLIKMNGDFMVDNWPVKMIVSDFVVVFVTIFVVGLLASWYPSLRATKTVDLSLKST